MEIESAKIGQVKLQDGWDVEEEIFVRHTSQIFEKLQRCLSPCQTWF